VCTEHATNVTYISEIVTVGRPRNLRVHRSATHDRSKTGPQTVDHRRPSRRFRPIQGEFRVFIPSDGDRWYWKV